jgi:hypothetical protein
VYAAASPPSAVCAPPSSSPPPFFLPCVSPPTPFTSQLPEVELDRNTRVLTARSLRFTFAGIPTKSGRMEDPNADLMEIFDAIDAIPNAPKKAVEGFLNWVRSQTPT